MAKWYEKQTAYWDEQPTTVDGVLGGYGNTSELELKASKRFLETHMKSALASGDELRAFDVGSGIGRITKDLLLGYFPKVDLLDQSPKQIEEARTYVPEADNFYCAGFQDFKFEHRYHCIWLQWFLMYLTDADLTRMLVKCRENLEPSGMILIKENVCDTENDLEEYHVDDSDNSVIRSVARFKEICIDAGLEIVAEEIQPEWPKDLYPVCMLALRPQG